MCQVWLCNSDEINESYVLVRPRCHRAERCHRTEQSRASLQHVRSVQSANTKRGYKAFFGAQSSIVHTGHAGRTGQSPSAAVAHAACSSHHHCSGGTGDQGCCGSHQSCARGAEPHCLRRPLRCSQQSALPQRCRRHHRHRCETPPAYVANKM